MPDFDDWYLTSTIQPASAETRAVLAWRRIQDRATSLVLDRDGVAQAAQTVRLDYDATYFPQEDATGISARRELVVFGVVDHPTVTDTDIRVGDRFAVAFDHYEVFNVVALPGEVQALVRRIS